MDDNAKLQFISAATIFTLRELLLEKGIITVDEFRDKAFHFVESLDIDEELTEIIKNEIRELD